MYDLTFTRFPLFNGNDDDVVTMCDFSIHARRVIIGPHHRRRRRR